MIRHMAALLALVFTAVACPSAAQLDFSGEWSARYHEDQEHRIPEPELGDEIFGTFGQATRTIWLDGRPHPPAWAAHKWAGFSTARWQGDMLTVETTHLKVGWIPRPASGSAAMLQETSA